MSHIEHWEGANQSPTEREKDEEEGLAEIQGTKLLQDYLDFDVLINMMLYIFEVFTIIIKQCNVDLKNIT